MCTSTKQRKRTHTPGTSGGFASPPSTSKSPSQKAPLLLSSQSTAWIKAGSWSRFSNAMTKVFFYFSFFLFSFSLILLSSPSCPVLLPELGLLGELQIAFVCFHVGHSFAAFERWKLLVCLFCGCDEVIPKQKGLFVSFFGQHIPFLFPSSCHHPFSIDCLFFFCLFVCLDFFQRFYSDKSGRSRMTSSLNLTRKKTSFGIRCPLSCLQCGIPHFQRGTCCESGLTC